MDLVSYNIMMDSSMLERTKMEFWMVLVEFN